MSHHSIRVSTLASHAGNVGSNPTGGTKGKNMNKFMLEAILEAKVGIKYNHGGPFGAVVVKDDKIVGRGHNKVVLLNDPTCHGEIMAIKDASKNLNSFDLEGCDLYTTGEPCPMCLSACLWANINNIYYGCTIEDNEDIGFRDKKFYEKLKIEKRGFKNLFQIDYKDCKKLFNDYLKLKNKTNY